MLTRMNAALLIAMMLLMVIGWLQLKSSDNHIARTLGEITERMEVLATPNSAEVKISKSNQISQIVYLDGDVPRPGVYNIPEDRALTLRLLLSASGFANPNPDNSISVMLHSGNQAPSFVSGKDLSDPAFDAVLHANDLVMVSLRVGASS